ncbi:MAG: gcdC [Firmicutes bacterium]|nr:gcdC [Bacillota bacterium]
MREFTVEVNGVPYSVVVKEKGVTSVIAPAVALAPAPAPKAAPAEVAAGDTPITAPMPGKITRIIAKAGAKVNRGDIILILEAMKMQNEIGASTAGIVKSIHVGIGQNVKPGEIMAVIG